ncbi:26S proteasome non-ATPase regulatory subunit 5-like [Actinia tenebrosa]|uniref:26S proteasome non-ATPase regulatory subunit 5 n=1 Tax=Actinia tenebrosa TaxID=6105 RepID=A0A6P8HR24_ACTTE|nr:26S proteasome non-ATPase regulatory subunit 5-like [Actinia tenebrosa]
MAAKEKCMELVENISNSSGEEILLYLKDLSILINTSQGASEMVSLIPCQLLFRCLKSSNDKQNFYCKSILKKVLQFEKPDAVVLKYHDYVIEGMNHSYFEIRELCLSEVERCSRSVNGVLALVDNVDLLSYVARCIADENLICAKMACKVLTNLSKHEPGLAILFQHQLQSKFTELLRKKEVIRFRVFDIFIDIQKQSDEAFEACKVVGIFETLLKELEGDDILVQMNCFELLSNLASSSERGLLYLEEHGVVVKLYNMLLSTKEDPMMELAVPGIVKFFGHVAHLRPVEVTQKYPQFMEQLYSQVSCGDLRLMPIAVETIGVIALTDAGLHAVFNNPARNKHIMKVLFSHAMGSDSDLRLRAFETLSSIFYSQENFSEELSSFLRGLYTAMANKPFQAFVSVAKQPFESLRCSCLRLMKCLAKYEWVQQDMVACPGYLEYLLDRKTEPEKSGRELKYDLIVELAHSPSAKQVFGMPYLLKLREYEREGPFFARAESTVAFEGAD